jgi:hypothetical protein
MSTASGEPTGPRASSGRRTAFRIIATIMGLSGAGFGLFTAVFGIVSEAQRIHAIHNSVVATLLLVLSAAPALAAARDPEHSTAPLTHLTAVGIAGLATMAFSLTLDPFTLPFILLVGVLWALRPARERPIPEGRPSWILLVLVLASAVPLVVYSLDNAELQRLDRTSEHAELYHWVETSFYAIAILLLALLAALRPAVYRLSAWSAGIGLVVLGVASLFLPGYASAIDGSWAWGALAEGVIFVAAAEWERRRLGPRARPGAIAGARKAWPPSRRWP